jgi:hypothetical protein
LSTAVSEAARSGTLSVATEEAQTDGWRRRRPGRLSVASCGGGGPDGRAVAEEAQTLSVALGGDGGGPDVWATAEEETRMDGSGGGPDGWAAAEEEAQRDGSGGGPKGQRWWRTPRRMDGGGGGRPDGRWSRRGGDGVTAC